MNNSDITRRHFFGTMFAGAASSLLGVGAASGATRLKIGVVSDIHISVSASGGKPNTAKFIETLNFFKKNGIRTHMLEKIGEGSEEIPNAIRGGYVTYVINTRDMNATAGSAADGHEIRQCAVENNVTVFTALDTVKVLLDVLEETTLGISTIDE